MGKGKIAAQAAHASLGAYKICDEKTKEAWEKEGSKKVVLRANTLDDLKEIFEKAKKEKLPCFLVKNSGLTQLKKGTITALAIGPAKEEKIDKITKKLKLL